VQRKFDSNSLNMEACHESANVSYGIYDYEHNVIQDDSIAVFFKNIVFISCTNDNYRIGATLMHSMALG
jgi:hypothetical protein